MKIYILIVLLLGTILQAVSNDILQNFSALPTRGTLVCKKKSDALEIYGGMQGGELRFSVSVKHLEKCPYLIINRQHEDGTWYLAAVTGIYHKKLTPLDAGRQKLNYRLSSMLAGSQSELLLAIKVQPEATISLESVKFSDKPEESDRFSIYVADGPQRAITTPQGKTYRIPRDFQDVTPPVRQEAVTFDSSGDDSGLRSYVLDDIEEIHPRLRPSRGEFDRSLRFFAAPGQQVGKAFSLYSLIDARQVSVTISPAISDQGKKLNNNELFTIRVWPQRLNYISRKYRDVPELLEKYRPLDIPCNTGQAYYLRLSIPSDAQSGFYKGVICFNASHRKASRLTYYIHVNRLKLNRSYPQIFGMYYGNPAEFKLLKQYGFNSLVQGHQNAMRNILSPLQTIARQEKNITRRMERLYAGQKLPQLNYTENKPQGFNNFMRSYQAAGFHILPIWFACSGFTDRIAKFLDLPLHSDPSCRIFPQKLTPEYRRLFQDCIQAVIQHAAKYQIEIYWYVFDEIGVNSQGDIYRFALDIFKLLKAAGARTVLTCAEDEFTEIVSPYLDMRFYSGGSGNARERLKRIHQDAKKHNSEFFSYNDCTREEFHIKRYASGYNMWISGWKGKYFWALYSGNNDWFNDFDGKNKDCNALYPLDNPFGIIRREPIPTLQLEAIRQGIDDFCYLYTVEQLAVSALASSRQETRKIGQAVQRELKYLKKKMPVIIDGTSWDCRNFERYCYRLAELGEALQEMLAGRPISQKTVFFPPEAYQQDYPQISEKK